MLSRSVFSLSLSLLMTVNDEKVVAPTVVLTTSFVYIYLVC